MLLALGRQKRPKLLQKPLERRLVFQDQVVAARQGNKPGAGDSGGESPALLERHASVLARVHHQRRNGHLGEQRADIGIAVGDEVARRVCGRGRDSLQLVEPVSLLLGGAGMNCEVKS